MFWKKIKGEDSINDMRLCFILKSYPITNTYAIYIHIEMSLTWFLVSIFFSFQTFDIFENMIKIKIWLKINKNILALHLVFLIFS